MLARVGDLVITPEGYYGILKSECEVLLGNGLSMVIEDDELGAFKTVPINANVEYGAVSNFSELLR